ncbi:MAG: 16S rRNA (adenine(1518)-N(6)/adenine(1519)-N(6))-dimethyltransferase RsmA [Gammaproteobacteria bacterium]|nr:16S rRNA (adenine(1518)-N(6)/adenine(1519)-N(6))-dimethyltransferase RsmA [Gammaproteobacteria bacterium]MDH4315742.1 16S rRNA (adenine(1518)-N(6)/adenine(1519)-N(6))-dimethyltransferase RsmA [Gammaproteobacteria bacterium]MDH5214152.1 16S rRNA (adenine(1518)-N(6)/adenine(1519)-N(6))-dimethyltransferase RsmA [Gammaproteobacteria bacterium]MDH5501568.1 16S rRNA (adenine(1518)-N(6)/adenine(1519)-N(6))-dimethyltransferase RsmA [Gammaproteobacteria bacterium]
MNSAHRPRKRFGQHFLVDSETISRIVEAIAPQANDTLVEIGPGEGAITHALAARSGKLHAIEFDRDLAAGLKRQFSDRHSVQVHQADAMKFDYSSLGTDLRIAGNLPYNISTPLLFHLVEHREHIRDMHFMLQKEVVDRITASPGSKAYGRLTVMLGCFMESLPLFDVGPESFRPPPKVWSSVLRMRPLPVAHFDLGHPQVLSRLVVQAFGKRRKTIRNALKGFASEEQLIACGIDPGARPEQVAIDRWVSLANSAAGQNEQAK